MDGDLKALSEWFPYGHWAWGYGKESWAWVPVGAESIDDTVRTVFGVWTIL